MPFSVCGLRSEARGHGSEEAIDEVRLRAHARVHRSKIHPDTTPFLTRILRSATLFAIPQPVALQLGDRVYFSSFPTIRPRRRGRV